MSSKKTSTSVKEQPDLKPAKPSEKPSPPKQPPRKRSPRKHVKKILKVTIQSLSVGTRFEHEGTLFRKAFPVDKTNQIGQKLVKAQFSDTLLLGQAKSFASKTLVEPK